MGITRVSTQLMIGPTEERVFSVHDIERRILRAQEIMGMNRLFFWNAGEERHYAEITNLCEKNGIEVYCWFPVLADLESSPVQLEEATLGITGERGYGISGRWDKLGQGEENFLFSCPGNLAVIQRGRGLLERLLDQYAFSGVFLDRIRHPSFANGLEAVFGCACPDCLNSHEIETGESRSVVVEGVQNLYGFLKTASKKDLASLVSFTDLTERFGLKEFFNFRSRQIDRVVAEFSGIARARGVKVGLDLLSPSLAYMVGQDYETLSGRADWIKIMTYCYANGPAGLPLEIASFVRGIVSLNTEGVDEEAALSLASRFFQLPLPRDCNSLLNEGLDPDCLRMELTRAEKMKNGASCVLIPGLELVNHPFFSPPVSSEQCLAYLNRLEGEDTEIVASWNIMYIPEEYQAMIKARIKTIHD